MFSNADMGSPYDALAEIESKFNNLDSDPYRELDDTTRGVVMAQPKHPDSFMFSEIGGKSSFDSDNVTNLFFSGDGYGYSLTRGCFETDPLLFSSPKSGCDISAALANWEGFQEHHMPPSPPLSRHFKFAPSTLLVEGCSPHQIGKSVLAFLTSQVVASVRKVRPGKYSIKAEVFVEGVSCTMKVRVYSCDEKYAVEVQRRAGDAFILQSTYRLLWSFLEIHCGRVSGQDEAPVTPVHPALPQFDPIDEDQEESNVEVVAPLLAMATVAGLQAEAASALAQMVKGGRVSAAPLLAAPHQVASTLKGLLTSGYLETVYPAARCVSDLASFHEAESILSHHGLLELVTLQAVAELRAAQGLVGTALARAVVDAVQCCAGSLTSAVASELQQLLANAMNDEALKVNSAACRYLEQAWFNTKLLA